MIRPAHCPFCMGEPDNHWSPGEMWTHTCGLQIPARWVWFPGEPDTTLAEYFASFNVPAAPVELKQSSFLEEL